MVYEVGKYNVSFEGIIYDGKTPYELVIIQEFDGNAPIHGGKKVLYIRNGIYDGSEYIIPKFETEHDVERLLTYPNNARIAIRNTWVLDGLNKEIDYE